MDTEVNAGRQLKQSSLKALVIDDKNPKGKTLTFSQFDARSTNDVIKQFGTAAAGLINAKFAGAQVVSTYQVAE